MCIGSGCCIRCSCCRGGVLCLNCYLSKRNHCENLRSTRLTSNQQCYRRHGDEGDDAGEDSKQPFDDSSKQQVGDQQTECQPCTTHIEDDDNNDNSEQLPSDHTEEVANLVDTRMTDAFGTTLLKSDGGEQQKRWTR